VLLLVLILVLIAFGLLVVALLSGSVLWAWVSVGVSVAAAAVLLVDWLQRRSAVRAGAEAGDAAAPAVPSQVAGRDAVAEPATEIIPAIRANPAPAESRTGPPVVGDERQEVQETVVLRSLAPPGSSGQPSGAHGGIGPAEPNWSQNVTNIDATGRPPGVHESDGAPAATQGDPDAEDTVKVAGAAPELPDEPVGAVAPPGGSPAGGPPAGGPLRSAPVEVPAGPPPGRAPDLPPLGPDGAPPEEPRDADAAALVAGVDDEVLVVDELPRYHLAGCRSLTSSAVIPLPAREAVELGFTPCAWCTPDRALSARHRAPVR
jgi:hypothetical protein